MKAAPPKSPYVVALSYVDERFKDSDAHIHKVASIDFDERDGDYIEIELTIKVDLEAVAASAEK